MSKDDLAEDIIENILGEDDNEDNKCCIYYCNACKRKHITNSRLGKLHYKYR